MPIARNLIAIFPETTFYGSVDIVVVANWKTTATQRLVLILGGYRGDDHRSGSMLGGQMSRSM